jgi:hypothetical protein
MRNLRGATRISTPTGLVFSLVIESKLGLELVDGAASATTSIFEAVTNLLDILSHKLAFDLVGGAARLINKTAQVSGHAREFARPEDD